MINVTITDKWLRVSGHAQRPQGVPPGQNIICAAVSAITLTLIEGLEQVAEVPIATALGDGYVVVEWAELNEQGRALVDTWLLGVKRIQESYGEITIL